MIQKQLSPLERDMTRAANDREPALATQWTCHSPGQVFTELLGKRAQLDRLAAAMRARNLSHGSGCKSTARAIAGRLAAKAEVTA